MTLLAWWPIGGTRLKSGTHMSPSIVSVVPMAYTAGSMYALSRGGTQKDVSSAGIPCGRIFTTVKKPKPDSVIAEGLKTGCILPLIRRDRVLGLVSLGRRNENAFSEADVGFLTQVASQIAIGVENALEYGQMTDANDRLAEQKFYLEDEI